MDALDKKYWEERYNKAETGWDLGMISPPIKEYIDQLTDKSIRILIPGCGNAYEAKYLWKEGFKNVFVVDVAAPPLEELKKEIPDFSDDNLICNDFFTLKGTFDLILEQTFFCAINPDLRSKYAGKAASLLSPKGKLVGLLFDDPLNENHPPFGGTKEEYISYFRPYFNLEIIDSCYNSIAPRAGRELFIKFTKQ